MKKLALITATLICFAGCARNDTGDMTEDTSGTGTAVGTPASSQSERSMSSTNTPSPSSTLNLDTNNPAQPSRAPGAYQSVTPPPTPPQPEPQPSPQQGQQPPQP